MNDRGTDIKTSISNINNTIGNPELIVHILNIQINLTVVILVKPISEIGKRDNQQAQLNGICQMCSFLGDRKRCTGQYDTQYTLPQKLWPEVIILAILIADTCLFK